MSIVGQLSKNAKSTKAQVIPLVIIILFMLGIGTTAYFLSEGKGNEISGFAVTPITLLDSCNESINTPGEYTLAAGIHVCPINSYGININASNVSLICADGAIIQSIGNDDYPGIIIVNLTGGYIPGIGDISGVNVSGCAVEGFQRSIHLYQVINSNISNNDISNASDEGIYIQLSENNMIYGNSIHDMVSADAIRLAGSSTSNDITENSVYDGVSDYLDITPDSRATVWANNFDDGVANDDSGTSVYCQNSVGNFYADGLTPGAGDCGWPVISYPGNQNGTSTLDVNWTDQDGVPSTVFYYIVNLTDSDTGVVEDSKVTTDNYTQFTGLEDVMEGSFKITITPSYDAYTGYTNESATFIILNDNDDDGYSSAASGDLFDCDDSDASIHPPFTNENVSGLNCADAVDNDCDGSIDWLDSDCGDGFTASPFNDTMYTDGSIPNISTVSGALIKNQYGRVVMDSVTNLSGVVLGDIFTIEDNLIVADPLAADGDRFNKEASITFFGLDYVKVPVLLVDGVECASPTCTDIWPSLLNNSFQGELNFTSAHFSTYNTTANSRMGIFTQADAEAAGILDDYPKDMETYHRNRFFVNYTKYPSGAAINNVTGGYADSNNGGLCKIWLYDPENVLIVNGANMTYNSYDGVYWFDSGLMNFTDASIYYHYNISCNSTVYEPIDLDEQFTIIEDVTPPIRPILYPQILIWPTNMTNSTKNTTVAGYFNESDINYTIIVMRGSSTYNFSGTSANTSEYAEYKDSDIVINFDATKGQNVTFVQWSPGREEVLMTFRWVEFSNHNRTYFNRYYIERANRTGDDIRIEFNETFEEDIDKDTTSMRLYTASLPSGHFRQEVELFSGENRITVWGWDASENDGYASTDWINAPYPDTAPPAPIIWPLPEAVRSDAALNVIGTVNDSILAYLNITVNFLKGYDFYTFEGGTDKASTLRAETSLANAPNMSAGNNFFYVDDFYYDMQLSSINWSDNPYVEFSNHNRTYWTRYNVINHTSNPGEDHRIYVSPNLTQGVDGSVVASFYNSTYPQGWFNMSLAISSIATTGLHEVYSVGFRNVTATQVEGPRSESDYIYIDAVPPSFDTTGIPSYSNIRTPVFKFNVSDDYKVDLQYLLVNVSNASWNSYYAYNSSVFPTLSVLQNISSCSDLLGNGSLYECSFTLNLTENGTYSVNVSAQDLAGWGNSTSKSMTIIVTTIDVLFVEDEDDIFNDVWLYFNWTSTGGELDRYEFALGNTAYPGSGFDAFKSWNSSCNVTGVCARAWVNFTHDMNASDLNSSEVKMKTGTIYYLTVRAKNLAGDYGAYASSDGILFIDPTPPQFIYLHDGGPWTDSKTTLSGDWRFEDNESDIIEYQYAIGSARYPNTGWNSVVPTTLTSSASVVRDALSLAENGTYYFNVKARNGNVAMNYSGSWSEWQSSPGIQVDTLPPYGGSINWTNTSYITTGYVTVHYNVGQDAPGASDNVKGLIEVGRGPLTNDVCPWISNFNWQNVSDILPGGESYRDVNVSSGYCYVFRLYTWDNATNSRTYLMPNETVRVLKSDTSAPTDVAPVMDDGFYSNSRTSLHANWADSSDAESGFSYYAWRIIEQPTQNGASCVVNTTGSIGTNCSEVTAGSTTVSEISLNTLNLTHNHKYFFEVRAWNKAGLNSTTRYSDGIIYLDNAPPLSPVVVEVNDDDDSSDGFISVYNSSDINITLIGDIDGYNDIANCVLLKDEVDYTELAPTASNCTETRAPYVAEDYPDLDEVIANNTEVTFIQCRNTTVDSGTLQGTFEWYVSCKDTYENRHNYEQSTHVEFEVDWPEPPQIYNLSLGVWFGGSDVDFVTPAYTDDYLICTADMFDNDANLNMSYINLSWFVEGVLVKSEGIAELGLVDLGEGYYDTEYDSVLDPSNSSRGQNVTCRVTVKDETGEIVSRDVSKRITNTEPDLDYLFMDVPYREVVSRNMTFEWSGPTADIDGDFYTYELWIDNDSVSAFNYSDNPPLNFTSATLLSGESIPYTQRNADVYGSKIVYEDNRAGNWDIYMYDIETGVETPIATSAKNELNPHIYDDFVLYEQNSSETYSVYRYNISASVKTLIVSSIAHGSLDFFGDYAVYNDTTPGTAGIRYKNILSGANSVLVSGGSGLSSLYVYGNDLVWIDAAGDPVIYDIATGINTTYDYSDTQRAAELFGSLFARESISGVINVTELNSNKMYTSLVLSGANISMYGGLIAYNNATDVVVTDLLINETGYNVSLGPGNNPVIYDDIIVWENNDDLYYARKNTSLGAVFVIEDNAPFRSYLFDTTSSDDIQYNWMMRVCDNSFENNSCVWANDYYGAYNYTWFIVDNAVPVISGTSPTDNTTLTGRIRMYAYVEDSPDYDLTGVEGVNYTLKYLRNDTVFFNNSMVLFSTWWQSPEEINFSVFDNENFTLLLTAWDGEDNIAYRELNFTADNDTPWFVFGIGAEEIGIDQRKAFNDSIRSDFYAYTVKTSTLRMYGPLPTTTSRFLESQVNLTVTNHVYDDDISTLTWPDGKYIVNFTGTNNDFLTGLGANRTFYVDHVGPRYVASRSPAGAYVYASGALNVSINVTDTTLVELNLTYNNTNSSNSTLMSANWTVNYGGANKTYQFASMAAYINKTFNWTFTMRDALNNTNRTDSLGVFVNSTPPSITTAFSNMNMYEDSSNTSNLNVSAHFGDLDMLDAVWGHLDNLTFAGSADNPNVTVTVNPTTGMMTDISSAGNFTGNVTVYFNATDYYGAKGMANMTVTVLNVNDAPYLAVPIPDMVSAEDNESGLVFNLSGYGADLEGDGINWSIVAPYNTTIISGIQYSDVAGDFNFTLVPDRWGVFNLTFKMSDGMNNTLVKVTVNVTSVEDAPTQPAITVTPTGSTPSIGSNNSGMIRVSWTQSTDGDAFYGDFVTYRLWYQNSTNPVGGYTINASIPNTTLYYDWNTSLNITDNQSINISVTAIDITARENASLPHGELTVDNDAADITITKPTLIMVGLWFLTDVTTDEIATCTFSSSNDSVRFNGSVTKSTTGTVHVVNVSGWTAASFNSTYDLAVNCVDTAGNPSSGSKLFEPHAGAFEFMSASASPAWVYAGQDVNVTLELAANNSWSAIGFDVNMTSPANNVTLAYGAFDPEINASNKFTSIILTPSDLGAYNLTIVRIYTADSVLLAGVPINVEDIFEVFNAVNQTLVSKI